MARKITTLMVLGLAVGLGTSAFAYEVNGLDGSQGWVKSDVRDGGTASVSADQPRNGNGSLKITVNDTRGTSQAKSTVWGYVDGTLGQLKQGQVSFDFLRDVSSTMLDYQTLGCKLYVTNNQGQTGSITWEWCYNGTTGNAPVTEGEWYDNVNITNGKFWVRSGGYNFAQIANMKTLADWANGGTVSAEGNTSIALGNDTRITGIEFGIGSGIAGEFTGYVDDVNVQFAGGDTYAYNFETPAVPEPASIMLGIMGLGSVLSIRRFRK